MKHISLLGSTGSIGKQTLEVVAANPDKLKVRALAAHRSDELLEQQIRQFEPDIAVLSDKDAAARLAARYHGKTKYVFQLTALLAAEGTAARRNNQALDLLFCAAAQRLENCTVLAVNWRQADAMLTHCPGGFSVVENRCGLWQGRRHASVCLQCGERGGSQCLLA